MLFGQDSGALACSMLMEHLEVSGPLERNDKPLI